MKRFAIALGWIVFLVMILAGSTRSVYADSNLHNFAIVKVVKEVTDFPDPSKAVFDVDLQFAEKFYNVEDAHLLIISKDSGSNVKVDDVLLLNCTSDPNEVVQFMLNCALRENLK